MAATSACSTGGLLILAERVTCQTIKEKIINFKGHLNLLSLVLEAQRKAWRFREGFLEEDVGTEF